MIIELDFRSDVPIARQIADAITLRALGGALDAGSPLPGVRELALQLQVNPNSIEQAYDLLLSEGVARFDPGDDGLTVAQPPQNIAPSGHEAFARIMRGSLDRALRAGLSAEQLRSIFEEAMEAIDGGD
ncbi:MAG: GntR family transcriptional regulator [Armatimonadota bacterium]